jgi:hypothetical protein
MLVEVRGRTNGRDHHGLDRDPIGEAKRQVNSEQRICAWGKQFGELRSEDVRGCVGTSG